jgi:hypothetical protein
MNWIWQLRAFPPFVRSLGQNVIKLFMTILYECLQ